jgi:succinate dehydrogenase/fumarate reductase flavoprotein subunit
VTAGLPATADVLVAGSGAAGLTAALAAAAAGASVLVAESASQLGGTTALSGGRVWVPCNHCPENASDTARAARAYLHAAVPARYRHMADAFIDHAPAMARFVESSSAHRFAACPRYPDYHPSRPGATLGGRCLDMRPADLRPLTPLTSLIRIPPGYLPMTHAEWEQWRYPQRFDRAVLEERQRSSLRTGGVALVAGLLDGVAAAGAGVVTGVRLTGVRLAPDGTVRGAELSRDGVTTTIEAGSVIIATGGFDWDTELRARHHPAPQRASGAPPANAGDGLRIARDAGAAVDNLGEGWWMPMMAVPGERMDGYPYYRSLIRERGAPRQIIVNAAGRRFADEAMPYNDFGKAMHSRLADASYPNDPAYMIFDDGFRRRYPLPGLRTGEPAPAWIHRGGSPAELARAVGIDPAGLDQAIARWNKACAEGADPDFGRGGNPYDRYGGDPSVRPNPNLGPLDQPPYYAVRVLAGTIGTKGGPVTDTSGVVLTPGGRRVRGLYAAGNTAAFWLGDGYPAPGATLAVGMTMGYLAGRHAAARASGAEGR